LPSFAIARDQVEGVTITQSISIVNDGVGTAGILAGFGFDGVTINAGAGDSVHLRGLTIEGRSDHPDMAIRLTNLGQFLKATNRLAEAEPLMRRALAIAEVSYGPDHPNTRTFRANLARLA
jgi:hypothetical protein